MLPFGNRTVIATYTGEQLTDAFENGVSPFCDVLIATGRFPQVSGLVLEFHCDGTVPVIDAIYKAPDGPSGELTPGGADRHGAAGDQRLHVRRRRRLHRARRGNRRAPARVTGLLEITVDYITANSPVDPVVEGRIVGP